MNRQGVAAEVVIFAQEDAEPDPRRPARRSRRLRGGRPSVPTASSR
ncbi:MAG: hypothetical protein MZW92_65480 [Comamonadaceae bacterium]|nr:hypothetical protein [Comamonadaceae bacterium]